MSESIRIFIAVIIPTIAGLWLGRHVYKFFKHRNHISGKLLIDTTGDKDRWTFVLDDDLGDVEKMDQVVLRIEKIE